MKAGRTVNSLALEAMQTRVGQAKPHDRNRTRLVQSLNE